MATRLAQSSGKSFPMNMVSTLLGSTREPPNYSWNASICTTMRLPVASMIQQKIHRNSWVGWLCSGCCQKGTESCDSLKGFQLTESWKITQLFHYLRFLTLLWNTTMLYSPAMPSKYRTHVNMMICPHTWKGNHKMIIIDMVNWASFGRRQTNMKTDSSKNN